MESSYYNHEVIIIYYCH